MMIKNNLNSMKFITFEGGEGGGKSTQSKILYEDLLSKGIPVILTREVGGTELAEKMRDILVHTEMFPMSELLQVMAARYDHVHKKIIPYINEGYVVICDRFIDSTACYQGSFPEIGLDLVYELHKRLISDLMPDITFFIDVDPVVALDRVRLRSDNNKFDLRELVFHKKIYTLFQKLVEKFPKRIVSVPATHFEPQQVHEFVKNHLNIYYL